MSVRINGDNSTLKPAVTGADTDTGLQCGTDELKLVTGGTARATVDSSGRLMVGTTSPGPTAGEQLTIADSANAGITIRSGTTAAGSILFEDTAQDRGEIQYSHNGDYMRFKTAGMERLRLDDDGHLQIRREGVASMPNVDTRHARFIVRQTNGQEAILGSIYAQGKSSWGGDLAFASKQASGLPTTGLTERMRLYANGALVVYNQPIASLSDSRAIDLSNTVLTSSNFYNDTRVNQGSYFSGSTGRFTCPVDGVYRIYFRCTATQMNTNVRLQKNGSTVNEAYSDVTSVNDSVSSEAIMSCVAGDYLQIQVARLKTLGGSQHKQVTFQLIA